MALPMSLKKKGIIYPDYNTMRAVLNGETESFPRMEPMKSPSYPSPGFSSQSSKSNSSYPVGKMNVSFYDRYGCRVRATLYYPAKPWMDTPQREEPVNGTGSNGAQVDIPSGPESVTIWPAGAPWFAGEDDDKFPIIIYGPGLFCVKTYYDWMGQLAAKGIAVLIIDFVNNNGFNDEDSETSHSEGLGNRYPDCDSPYPENWPDLWPWVYELVDSIDWVQGYTNGEWSKEGNPDHEGEDNGPSYIDYPLPSPLFDLSGKFDTIYLAGHSTGGTMGLVASSFDERITKLIPMANYDEGGVGVTWHDANLQAKGPYPSDNKNAITEPILFMVGEHDLVAKPCNDTDNITNSDPYGECSQRSNSYYTYQEINCQKCLCLFENNDDTDPTEYVNHQSWCDKDSLSQNDQEITPGGAYCETVQKNARQMISKWIDDDFDGLKAIIDADVNKINYVTNISSLLMVYSVSHPVDISMIEAD